MRRTWILAVGIAAILLCLAMGWGARRYQRQAKEGSRLREAEAALRNSDARSALQIAAKIPETARDYTEAQAVEWQALYSLEEDTVEPMNENAKNAVARIVDLKIKAKRLRAEMSGTAQGSARYTQLDRELKELGVQEQSIIQSNPTLAAGYGTMTAAGKERALELVFETVVGHPIDSAGKKLIERIVQEKNRHLAEQARRDYAARSQADSIARGSTDFRYTTGGDSDTVLIVESVRFTELDLRLKMSRIYREGSNFLCEKGFDEVELKLPSVSEPEVSVPLACAENPNTQ
jgi:hypothetical protein